MYKRYKYRIYPNKTQQIALTRWFGCARFVWNRGVELNEYLFKVPHVDIEGKLKGHYTNVELDKFLPRLKDEFPWLKETYASCLQQVNRDLHLAVKSYFKGDSNRPKFKSKFSRDSIRFPIRLVISDRDKRNAKVHLPKLGKVKMRYSRKLPEHTSSTLTRSRDGKYYISFVVKAKSKTKKCHVRKTKIVGVDLGVKDLAIASDGTKYSSIRASNENVLLNIHRLARHRERLLRKKPGSKSYRDLNRRINILVRKLVNQRRDYLHKVAYDLSAYRVVTFEDLNTQALMDVNVDYPGLKSAIQFAGWRDLIELTSYRMNEKGGKVLFVNPHNTTKRCSSCGWINEALTLSDRVWDCLDCGVKHDRDINAAVNIKELGKLALKEFTFGTGYAGDR